MQFQVTSVRLSVSLPFGICGLSEFLIDEKRAVSANEMQTLMNSQRVDK